MTSHLTYAFGLALGRSLSTSQLEGFSLEAEGRIQEKFVTNSEGSSAVHVDKVWCYPVVNVHVVGRLD